MRSKSKRSGVGGRNPVSIGVEAVTSRWTVRGVSPAVSDLAVLEAGRRGLTVGDWLTLAIVRSSTKFKK